MKRLLIHRRMTDPSPSKIAIRTELSLEDQHPFLAIVFVSAKTMVPRHRTTNKRQTEIHQHIRTRDVQVRLRFAQLHDSVYDITLHTAERLSYSFCRIREQRQSLH